MAGEFSETIGYINLYLQKAHYDADLMYVINYHDDGHVNGRVKSGVLLSQH
jgi:hypothetical protein